MMSRADYVMIADTIATSELTPDQRASIAGTFAARLAHDNPRFDRRRFVRAATEPRLTDELVTDS